ncbi:unnamed protein product [Mortierella alpina]
MACLLPPILWQEINLLNYAPDDFVAQFQHYHGFIRSLSFSIPSACDAIKRLFGAPSSVKSPQPGARTLTHCTRLQSLRIDFDEECYHSGHLDHDFMAETIDRVVEANLSTLKRFVFSNLPYSIEDGVLDQISKMSSLESLTLEEWGALNGPKLLAILKSRRSTLRTLSLEMNELSFGVETFEDLQRWRAEVEGGLKSSGKTAEDKLHEHLAANLTRITTLVLDRSTIDPITLTRLVGVMPDLRKLSLLHSFGLTRNMDYLQDEVDDELFHPQPADHIVQHMHPQNPVPATSNHPISPEANIHDEGASAGGEEIQEDPRPSDDEQQAEEQGNRAPANAAAHTVWNTVYDHDLDEYDEDLGDEFEDYLGSGDEDLDHGYHELLYHAEAAESLYDYDPNMSATGLISIRHQQTRMLQSLHRLCPKIETFDFTGCRTEGVDHHLLLNVCRLWGSAGSASSGYQASGGIKVLDAGDVLPVERSFFNAVWTHCSTTLTGLDLSWNHCIRSQQTPPWGFGGHIRPTEYYDDILNIMTSCHHLEYLYVEPYPVNGRTIQLSSADWVCTKLKSLQIHIGIEHSYAGDEDEVRIAVCKQLGRLVRLETLHLESQEPSSLARGRRREDTMVRNGLYLSLATGLEHLAGLENLKSLDISRMVSHGLREEAEVAWIVDHWPALENFVGLLDQDALAEIAKEIRTQLGPPAQLMPIGFARQNAMKRQRAGILLPVELDLNRNPLTRRLRDRGIDVDPRVMDEVLLEEQLQIVAHEDKDGPNICHRPNGGDEELDEHGNRPPPQMFSWVVCYLPSATQSLADARPGGRANDEYMSYVMRPRGGRSPSPLGTWY